MTEELKPCPFCGSAPEQSERADNNTSTGRAHFIACMCGGYSANAHQFGETKEEVASNWNRRAAPSVANVAAANEKQTDLAKRLLFKANDTDGNQVSLYKAELIAICCEANRYYIGMLNWKASAEAKDAAIAALDKPVVAMTGDECHKILKAMALDADDWAEGLNYEPTEQEISKRCVEFILAAHAGQGAKA